MKNKFKITASFICAAAVMTASIPTVGATASEAPPVTDYTITIPATLTVENSGWNELTGGIKASGTLEKGKKLVVSAASENSWNLVANKGTDNESKVGYNLAATGDNTSTYNATAEAPTWEFTELTTDGTSQTAGIIVEDYSAKPAGTYQDVVTFTASVESYAKIYTFDKLTDGTVIHVGEMLDFSSSPYTYFSFGGYSASKNHVYTLVRVDQGASSYEFIESADGSYYAFKEVVDDGHGLRTDYHSRKVPVTSTSDGVVIKGSGNKWTFDTHIPVTNVMITDFPDVMEYGQSYTLRATVTPSDAYNTVEWSSSKPSVLEINKDTGECTVKAKTNDLVEITATAGDKKATCIVYVLYDGDPQAGDDTLD